MTREEEAAGLLGEARETITDLSAGHDVLLARIDAWLAGRREDGHFARIGAMADALPVNEEASNAASRLVTAKMMAAGSRKLVPAADAPAVGSRWTHGSAVAWTCVRRRAETVTLRSEFGALQMTLPEFRAQGWRPVESAVEPAPLVVRDDGVTFRAKGED